MKKIMVFVVVPLIVLIFGILSCLLLYGPTTLYPYTASGQSTQIWVVDDVYFVKSENNGKTEIEDFGTMFWESDRYNFLSEKTDKIEDMQLNNVFCITYQGQNYYAYQAIALIVFYCIVMLCGIITVGVGLYRNKKDGK